MGCAAAVVPGLLSAESFLRLRMKKKMAAPITARPQTPPTTPPTMARVLLFFSLFSLSAVLLPVLLPDTEVVVVDVLGDVDVEEGASKEGVLLVGCVV